MYFKAPLKKILILSVLELVVGNELSINACEESSNPSRIVVAGGSITEILYFLNEESRILGVDVTSNFPKNATKLPSIGYVRNLSAEGILSLNPTLVLGENDMGPPMVLNQLKEVDTDLRIIPEERTVEGIINKILCIASIIDNEAKAKKNIDLSLKKTIMELQLLKNNPEIQNKKIMLILSMQGTSPIVAGKGTSGDGFIKIVGAQNVFQSFEGWKPVSVEAIIKINPDYFIIPSREIHKNSDIQSLTTNPIFSNTEAGAKKNFIFEDSMAMLGFGPRTIITALKVAKQLSQ
tara:strand:+ start:623 stop:1501 length:879 start_codon:yes stop_codon:yes gene_type:complete